MNPPKLPLRFLRWFCRPEYLEEIEGNLVEMFDRECESDPAHARRQFTRRVVRHFRPAFIKRVNPVFNLITTIDMLRHNLLITFRNFMKYRSTFFINMTGLSTGLATVLLVYLWVSDEWSKDRYNVNDERLYQVLQNTKETNGTTTTGRGTAGILSDALSHEFPEVEYAVSVVPPSWFYSRSLISFEDKKLKVTNQFAGKDFFKVFTTQVIRGDERAFLQNKYSLMIAEDLAQRLFGSADEAVGKMVQFQWEFNEHLYEVAGVYRLPEQATERYEVLANYEVFLDSKDWLKEWGSSDPRTFVLLKEGADREAVAAKLEGFMRTKEKESTRSLVLQKYSDTYLYNRFEDGRPAGGRIEYVRLFTLIAVVILVIACVNFMNLSTARATRRLKEVGVKKAIGARRSGLAMQFLSESMSLAVLSAVVALLIVWLVMPTFNETTGKHLFLRFDRNFLLVSAFIIVVTGLISGSYPALYLSRFRAGEVLKGKIRSSVAELLARKGLVVFQYCISFMLIVGVIVVQRQIRYVQSKNLGYDREQVLHFDLEINPGSDPSYFEPGGTFEKHVETFIHESEKVPGVAGAANFWHDVTGSHGGLGGVEWQPGDDDVNTTFSNLEVGYDFLQVLGIQLAQGRFYSRDRSGETSKIIINERAAKLMGFADPIGRTIRLWGHDREIIGVVRDFHFESLYREVEPCLIQLVPPAPRIMVKLEAGKTAEGIAGLKKLYEQTNPGLSFEYRFLDDDYNALYAAEQRVSKLSQIFSILAIVISCLGLYGLTAFTAERRKKEISIRKVFGASPWTILRLLTTEFAVLIVAAVLAGVPIAWMAGRAWLASFAYRSELSPWYFVSGGVAIVLITLVTVSWNTVRAARANPGEVLRSE